MRLALPLILLLVATGCDSSDDALRLDNDFYVGTWELLSVTDGSGDQTDFVNGIVDDFAISFEQDRGFRLDADFNDFVNLLQDDVEVEGTYEAQPNIPALVLIAEVDGTALAPSFQTSTTSEQQVSLTAPAEIVRGLLGGSDLLPFTGDVTLTVQRR